MTDRKLSVSASDFGLRDPTFKPIVKRLWVEPTGSGQGGGFAFFELSPKGLRWWWEGESEVDAEYISPSRLTDSSFVAAADCVTELVTMARVRIREARRLLSELDSRPGLRLLTDPDASVEVCETCGGDGALLGPQFPAHSLTPSEETKDNG